MKWLKYLLLLVVLWSFPAHAIQVTIIGGSAVSPCVTTNVIFWWRCEVDDFTAASETTDYSTFDKIATLASDAAINTDAVKDGTNGLDLPTASDYASFTDSVPATFEDEGRIGFWVRLTTFTDTRRLFMASEDVYDYFILRLDGTDELELYWYDANTARTEFVTSGANLATGIWYFIEAAWNTSTNYREIFVNGVSYGSSAETISSFDSGPAYISFGDGSGTAQDTHIDHIIISTDSTQNLYLCASRLNYDGS